MKSVLVIGSVGFDTIRGPEGVHERVVGGAATYASIAVSLHTEAQLVAVVGRDFGDEHIQVLRDRDICLKGLEVKEGKTFFWDGEYNDTFTSRESLITELNVLGDFSPKVPESYRTTPYLLLGNIDPELQLQVLEQMKRPELVVTDTMNFWIEGKRDALLEVLKHTDVFILNDEEARQLTGKYAIASVAKDLLSLGPSTVVIKQGEYGALLFKESHIFSVPALPLETVKDPTGAGDSFAGGFLGYIAKRAGDDVNKGQVNTSVLRRAMFYGTAAASFCVEGIGTSALSTASKDAMESRYDQVVELSHIA